MDLYLKHVKRYAFIICLLLVNTALSAQNNKRVSINNNNITLQAALAEVQKQSGMSVAYNDSQLPTNTISLDLYEQSVETTLTNILKGTNFSYSIEGNYIMIVPKQDEKQVARKKVSGTMIDPEGNPLTGVTIMEKGTRNGTITDTDGNYSLTVPNNATLQYSYIGYQTIEKKVSGEGDINLTMMEDSEMLDDVVVTALGIKRQSKALGYNLEKVSSDKITTAKDANFINSLTGKVAGLQINSSSGGVGSATKVVMRGAKSISKNNNVLYVIDGVPLFNQSTGGVSTINGAPERESIADINPEDIESMSVLTGPSAAALYGSNAANGAILITTKKGKVGKATITLTNNTDFMSPFITPRFQNTYGNASGEFSSWGDKLETPSSYDPTNFFRTGFNTTTSLSVSTGTEKNQTFISAAATNAGGLMPNNDYNRYNVTFRNTSKFINDKLTADIGASYIKQDDQNPTRQGEYLNPLIPLYLFPRGEDFSAMQLYERYDESRNIPVQYWPYGDTGMQNPYWIVNRNMFINKRDRYMMNLNLKYDIIDGLNVAGRVRLDNEYGIYEKKLYAGTSGQFAQKYGNYSNAKRQNKQVYADLIANLNKSFGDFDLTANLGTSISDLQYNASSYGGHLKQIPNFFSVDNIDLTAASSGVNQTRWREQTQSIFASAELGWRSMLYLSLTGRNDWASQLANTEQSSFFYPSVGLSAIVSEMLKMPKQISYLKLRGSYSQVGSPISRNISIPTYSYNSGGVLQTISRYPIDKLYPEMTTSYEAGLDTRLFGNRIELNATYYKSNTKNQTFEVPISSSTSYTSMIVQTGNIQNQGLELSLGYNDEFFDKNLRWNSTVTFSLNRNKIISLAGDLRDPITGAALDMPDMKRSVVGSYFMKLVEGGSIGDIYTTKMFYTDNQGDIYVDDSGKFGTPVTGEFKIGNTNPDYNLGFMNSFSYKGIDLGFLITARVGGEVVSGTEAVLDYYGVSERSAIARDNGGIQVNNGLMDAQYYYQFIGDGGGGSGMMSQYVYSATNVRLQELTLGYNLPKKWFNDLLSIKVSFVGRNLWMIYNKAPFDPEVISSTGNYLQGFDYFMMPSTRNLGFSVKITY